METFLAYFAVITLIVVTCLLINEKTFRMPPEIALLIFSLAIGGFFKLLFSLEIISPMDTVMETLDTYNVNDVLMNVFLCFMLFSGASDLKYRSLKENFKAITLLALLSTILSTLAYGGLVYLLLSLFGFSTDFAVCLLLGAIISPTDPIAATGILNKLGLPEKIVHIMEGESLFNDGVGVALFLFVKGIVTGSGGDNFFVVMSTELLGAIALGLVISFICGKMIKITENSILRILISLMAVSACYTICESCGFSGVIASVVCGIYFATIIEKYETDGTIDMSDGYYHGFWTTVDQLLNYVLYVIIGLSFIYIVRIDYAIFAALVATVVNFASRYVGVFASSLIIHEIPGGFTVPQFSLLFTWGGLRGGLCLALVMSLSSEIDSTLYTIMLFIVFGTILFTTIVQGLTVDKLYLYMKKKQNQ